MNGSSPEDEDGIMQCSQDGKSMSVCLSNHALDLHAHAYTRDRLNSPLLFLHTHACLSTAAHGFSLKSVGADWNSDNTTVATDALSARDSISTRASMDRSSIGTDSDELVKVSKHTERRHTHT